MIRFDMVFAQLKPFVETPWDNYFNDEFHGNFDLRMLSPHSHLIHRWNVLIDCPMDYNKLWTHKPFRVRQGPILSTAFNQPDFRELKVQPFLSDWQRGSDDSTDD